MTPLALSNMHSRVTREQSVNESRATRRFGPVMRKDSSATDFYRAEIKFPFS